LHPSPGRQQREAVFECRYQLSRSECAQARGSKLERERQSVELPTDIRDERRVVARHLKIWRHSASPIRQQTHRT
jgi:hypothetical protein